MGCARQSDAHKNACAHQIAHSKGMVRDVAQEPHQLGHLNAQRRRQSHAGACGRAMGLRAFPVKGGRQHTAKGRVLAKQRTRKAHARTCNASCPVALMVSASFTVHSCNHNPSNPIRIHRTCTYTLCGHSTALCRLSVVSLPPGCGKHHTVREATDTEHTPAQGASVGQCRECGKGSCTPRAWDIGAFRGPFQHHQGACCITPNACNVRNG